MAKKMTKRGKASGSVGAARVRWLRDTLDRLRAIAADVERIYVETEELWQELDHTDWVQSPDPLTFVSWGEGDSFPDEIRERIAWIEERQEEVEARLRGEWREEWAAKPAPMATAAAQAEGTAQ